MSQPFTMQDPFTYATKTKNPRDWPKAAPYVNPFSKEGIERHEEMQEREATQKRQFVESLDLAFAKFEEQKKEVCIMTLGDL